MPRLAAFPLAALLLASCAGRPEPTTDVVVTPNVTYAVRNGLRLSLDLHRPRASRPLPAVVWIHGGGWRAGTRSDPGHLARLAGRGFVGVAIDHRPSTTAPFPAACEDVREAVRWLRANAPELGIDPDRIGLWGASSGGHLALLVACDPEPTSRVQAACAWYAPTDLRVDLGLARNDVQVFLGASIASPTAREASPVVHASAGDPPVLLVHGERDQFVPVAHARAMAEALPNSTLIEVRNARHGFEGIDGEPDPSSEEILEETIEFFEKTLR